MKYAFNDVVIEITRKCNMKCGHCLRGNSQNMDMNNEYIRSFLTSCSSIGMLTISGGEPSLNIKGMQDLLSILKELNIAVGYFYVVTNGSKTSYSNEFILAMIDLWAYQDEKHEYSTLQMSIDEYHDSTHQKEAEERLSALSFFSIRNNTNLKIIPEGTGKNLPHNKHKDSRYAKAYSNSIDIEDEDIETQLYLNCEGKILTNCDLSYSHQRKLKGWNLSNFNSYLENRGSYA